MKPFDKSGAFRPDYGGRDVRSLAVRGAGVTVFSGGLGLLLQIASTVILARLLTPKDFGLVTIVTTFSLLLVNFGLNGFTEAVLQTEELNHSLVSNLFWINSGIGLCLTISFAAFGTILARVFHEPLVTQVAVGIAPTILITSLSVQHIALLKRDMKFSVASVNEIISRASSLGISILMAWLGWGYWALVAGALAQPLIQGIGAWILCPWLPGFPSRMPGTSTAFRFAMNVFGRFTLNYFSRNTDNMLIAWRFNSVSLGFYKRAYDLFALSASQLTAPITNVAVAALSRYNPRSPQYRQHLLSAISLIAFVGMGLSAEFTLIGKDLIRVLLGPGWETSGKIFVFFAPGIGPMLVYYVHSWIHLSIGRADRWLRWGVLEIVATFLFFVVGLHWGPEGIATAWSASFMILTLPSLWYAGRPIDFGILPVVAVTWKYIVASVLASCTSVLIARPFSIAVTLWGPARAALAAIAFNSLLVMVTYLVAVVVLHRGRAPIDQFLRVFAEMISRHKLSKKFQSPLSLPAAEVKPQPCSTQDAKPPLVSILIPAYNAQEWIADSLRSVIAQTWEPKEIIVVDDGSTDQTLAIAREFESANLRVVTQSNQGAAAARNKALSLALGDYIQWLDADDLLAPDKIALQMKAVANGCGKRILLSAPFGRFKYRYYRTQFIPTSLWKDQSAAEWLMHKLGENVYMQTATWLVSRELTDVAGPWNTQLLGDDDGEYFCRVLLASEGTRFIPDARVYYRAPWFGTLSHIGKSKRKIDAHWLSMQLHISYLRSLDDSERARNACLKYLQTSFIYFYPERTDIVGSAQQLAKELGGRLEPPRLNWKYSWIKLLFGWAVTKRLQAIIPQFKWLFVKSWDKALFRVRTRFFRVQL